MRPANHIELISGQVIAQRLNDVAQNHVLAVRG
jgi:hypothetical protein